MTEEQLNRLHALEEERATVVAAIQDIDAQLSAKRKYDPDGRMWGVAEYHEWRTRAVTARTIRNKRLRTINVEIKALRRVRNERAVAAMGLDASNPDSLISHAYNLLRRLACEGVDLDAQEQATVDALRHYLAHVGAKESA